MTIISQSAGYLNFYNTVALLAKEYAPADYVGFYANTTDIGPVTSNGTQWAVIGGGASSVSVLSFGADPTGVADSAAAFLAAANASSQVSVPAGTFKIAAPFTPSAAMTWLINNGAVFSGTNNIPDADGQIKFGPYPNTWVNSVGAGVFEYLESQSAFNVRGHLQGIGEFISGRSSTSPGAGVGAINYASFVYNDNTSFAADVWNYYGTALRLAGATGHTHGMELDVLNTGALVQWLPGSVFPAGLTDCLWIGAGGEFAATAGTVNPATCALGIIRNDSSARATFDKGIIFQNTAINGTNGATGNGIAIALATGHVIQWFNNAGATAGAIFATGGVTNAQSTFLNFAAAGLEITSGLDNSIQAIIAPTPSAVNRVVLTGAITGNPAKIAAQGTDAVVNLFLTGQGGASVVQAATVFQAAANVALPASGSTACGVLVSSTANLGFFYGTGAPTFSAAEGSLYSNTTGVAGARLYANTSAGSGTTWTAAASP